MSGGLRLLRRFSSFEIPRPWLLLTHGNLTASRNLSSPFPLPTPTRVGGGNGRRRLLIPHRKRNLSEVGFCGRDLTTEDTVANPILSPYLSVRIRCSKDVSIILSEALLCFGASSASIDEVSDPKDGEIYVTSIFPDGQDVHTCIWHAADSIGLNHVPSYDVSVGEQCDWIMNMQETFHPIEVTKGLWIIPEWRTPIDLQATNIILNPGMAFGTGEHPTTKLCLLLLHDLIKGGECFLDYGTGSGVLGIAAVKMGAALSVGIDIEPQAVTSARQNIALNKIDSSRMSTHLIDGTCEQASNEFGLNAQRRKFDLIIANILLNPLLELAKDIVAYGKPGALVGVSGILTDQVGPIQERYSQFLDNISISEMDGSACLSGTKK